MDNSRLVDLLLVRLTRDEEKKKVEELLISEMGMSSKEARENIDNSPSILQESVEMEQARILQDRMYPFVDLLPRHYGNNTEYAAAADDKSEEPSNEIIDDDIFAAEEEEEELHPDDDDTDQLYYDQSSVNDVDNPHTNFDEEDDNSLIITSAAEEMLTVERCHICGRTPTGENKLVPCRTCGQLTCSNCFNRKYHVCEKCASEGKAVDKPLDSVPSAVSAKAQVSHNDTQKITQKRMMKSAKSGLFSKISPMLIVIIALISITIAFLIIDPINLFASSDNGESAETVYADTLVIPETDSLSSDSVNTSDTTVVSTDSLLQNTLAVNEYISLRDISLPDSLPIPEEYALPVTLTSSPGSGIEIAIDSLQLLVEPLAYLAAVYAVEFDGISLITTEDGYNIFVMSILHPEPAEKRTAVLGNLGLLFDSTMVDQIVLYYRENQYYSANLFSFTSDSFSVLSLSGSPNVLQRKQALIPETTDLIYGTIFEWMTDLN